MATGTVDVSIILSAEKLKQHKNAQKSFKIFNPNIYGVVTRGRNIVKTWISSLLLYELHKVHIVLR